MNKIFQVDVLEGFDSLDDESIDLILTSPPYNMNREYEKNKVIDEYVEWQGRIIKEAYRVLKGTGNLIWQVGSIIDKGVLIPIDSLLYPTFLSVNFKLKNRIVWTFNHGFHAKKKFSGRYEVLLWYIKGEDYTFNLDPVRIPQKYPNKKHYRGPNKGKLSGNPLGKNPGDVWEIVNIKSGHPEKTNHPCQFPEQLVERCILSLSNNEDIVLDPFVGSGTTAVVANRLGRKYIGFDIMKEYIEIAERRIGKGKGKQDVLVQF